MNALTGRSWWLACFLVLAGTLAATIPTTGDIGLTWDEPAYRYSQTFSAQWWEQVGQVRSWDDAQKVLEADRLLYFWPYARYGVNFHPPLAGQLNLLTYEIFGSWMKDIPARRMSSVLEYSFTIAILFGFLASRYGFSVGIVAAGSLLLMPRLYGDGHIAGTDTPGLFLWACTAVAFWKGLYDPNVRPWRIVVGVLLGLAFVEKIGAVLVLVPLLLWLGVGHLPQTFARREGRADWVDGLFTLTAQVAPLALALREILRLVDALPPSNRTNLYTDRPPSDLPAAILLVPLAVWAIRSLLRRFLPGNAVWGRERPALETLSAILAFAPVIAWLGNPAWWRETLVRLAHYYAISVGRRGSLPDVQILYMGQGYEYSLPWHNAWVLIAITVPAGILAAAIVGVVFAIWRLRFDRLPFFFLVHLLTLPVMRMLPTPSHDGVRLFLPTFFFLAGLAGWGLNWVADGIARVTRVRALFIRLVLATLTLGSAALQLIKIHPFELSYYNELIGGPAGAWRAGFELTYWYDALNDQTLAELRERLPQNAEIVFSSYQSSPSMVIQDLQSLGKLRSDLELGNTQISHSFPYEWLLTHDSKAMAFTRLLFVMRPWYELRPPQLDHLRVLTVADPVAVSRAWALQRMLDAPDTKPADPPAAPAWVRAHVPWLGRLWGDGVTKLHRLCVHDDIIDWAKKDPESLRIAARAVAEQRRDDSPDVQRLRSVMGKNRESFAKLVRLRPQAIREAVEILIARPDDVRKVMQRYSFTDPDSIGGYLDRDLPKGDL